MNNLYWELIVKKLSDQLTEEQELVLENWLAASDENRSLFQQAAKLLKLSNAPTADFEADADEQWMKLKAQILRENDLPQILKPKRYTFKIWHAAAGLALIIGLGFLFRSEPSVSSNNHIAASWTQVVSLDSITQITLPDSSQVLLNINSTLSYPQQFNSEQRIVQLQGEGYFKVKPDSKHPFKVTAHGTEILVLGTSFNVKAEDQDRIEVAVDEGEVKFTPDADDHSTEVNIKKGNAVAYNQKEKGIERWKHRNPPKWLEGVEDNVDEFFNKVDRKVKKLLKKPK